MWNETPRNIRLVPNPNQTRKLTLLGRDEFGNSKEEVIFCTPEEAEQIELLFRVARADGVDNEHLSSTPS